jgi:hypothetical protein
MSVAVLQPVNSAVRQENARQPKQVTFFLILLIMFFVIDFAKVQISLEFRV